MIRLVRALVWLRWRGFVNIVRVGGRRDELERFARIGAALMRVLYAIVFVPVAVLLSAGALVGGHAMAGNEEMAVVVLGFARVILAIVTLAVLSGPFLRSMGGLDAELRRLLLMPIPQRVLHAVEAGCSVLDPWVVPVIAALALLPAGLLAGGAGGAAAIATAGALAFVVTLAGLGGLAASLTTLVLRDRRRAELASFVLVLGLTLTGVAPALFGDATPRSGSRFQAAVRLLAPLPSEQLAAAVGHAVDGRIGRAATHVAGLGVVAAMVFACSAALHRRVLDSVASGGRTARRGVRGPIRSWLPGTDPPTAAVAWTVWRTSTRTVRGRVGLLLTPVVLVAVWAAAGRTLAAELSGRWSATEGPLMLTAAATLAALSLQPMLLNQFAVDGPGLTLSLLAPLRPRQLVRGKLLGQHLLATAAFGLCVVVTLVATRSGDVRLWLAAALSTAAGFALIVPLAALLSILFPKSADLSRIGGDGNPHAVAGFVGAVASAAVFGAASSAWLVPGVLGGRPGAALATAGAGLVVALVAARAITGSVVGLFERRREALALVAHGR